MDMRKTGLLAVGGCAAACAGTGLVPVLIGGAAGGGLAAVGGDAGVAAVVAILAALAYVWIARRDARACACATEGDCGAAARACILPDRPEAD